MPTKPLLVKGAPMLGALAVALAVSACGGGGHPTSTTTSRPPTTVAKVTTTGATSTTAAGTTTGVAATTTTAGTSGTSASSAGGLKPTPVGTTASCHSRSLAGGSEAAEISVAAGVSCTTANQVVVQAATAKGTAFAADFYNCTPTQQGAGSTWAKAWKGSYYEYVCTTPTGGGIAFNWGTGYTG